MQLENKILIDTGWDPEVGKDYMAEDCLVQENIKFTFKDWEKLAVNKLADKDILYAPYCNIPDHKLLEKYPNVTITKDITLATKFVISDQLLSRVYDFTTPVESLTDNPDYRAYRSYLFREVPMSIIYRYKEFRKLGVTLPKSENFVYIRDRSNYSRNNNNDSIFTQYPLVRIKPNRTYYHSELVGTKKQIGFVKQLLEVKKDNKIKFIFESTILAELDKDSNIIDKPFYEQLRIMLDSSNVEEQKLAYEIIANCEREKSKIYTLLLLNEFAWRINQIEHQAKRNIAGYSKIKNTNYKSLLSYYNLRASDLLLNWDTYSAKIIEKCKLSDSDISILKEFIINKLNDKYEKYKIKIESICLV